MRDDQLASRERVVKIFQTLFSTELPWKLVTTKRFNGRRVIRVYGGMILRLVSSALWSGLVLLVLQLPLTATADTRDLRPFQETSLEEAGLVVLVPAKPQWVLSLAPLKRNQRIELSTPPNYYPATSIQIVRDAELGVLVDDLDRVAESAMQNIRSRLGIAEPVTLGGLQSVRLGKLTGFEDNFSIRRGGAEYDFRNIVGTLPSGHLVSIMVSTPGGQIAHIEHIVEKILVNLREL